jgi:RNA polymerase sigma-70 factor, ECF subfamily
MNEAELNDLFASCLPKLKKAARRMLCNQQDSEDALQEGLLLAFQKLHQFEGRSSFATWLHSIVRNASRMQHCKVSAHPGVPIESEFPDETPVLHKTEFVETGPSPEEICIQKERSEIIRKATTRMPARYQPAIQYFHWEGLSEQETAQKLCLTSSALKSQLHRSRRMLTSRIRKSYVAVRARRSGFYRPVPPRLSARCAEESRVGEPQPKT